MSVFGREVRTQIFIADHAQDNLVGWTLLASQR